MELSCFIKHNNIQALTNRGIVGNFVVIYKCEARKQEMYN